MREGSAGRASPGSGARSAAGEPVAEHVSPGVDVRVVAEPSRVRAGVANLSFGTLEEHERLAEERLAAAA